MTFRVTHSAAGNLLCDKDGCKRVAVREATFADHDPKNPPMRATAIGRGIYCRHCKPSGPWATHVWFSKARGPWKERP